MFGWVKNAALKRLATTAVRHALSALGVYLVSRGYTTEADWSSIALDVSPIIIALVWSLIEKANQEKHQAQAVQVALALPSGSTPADLRAELDAQKGS